MTSVERDVAGRLAAVRERIAAAARRAGRDPAEVTLVGAAKRQPPERLRAAWAAGLRVFGENRVQEAEEHRQLLPPEAEWHLIGPLQSNKTKRALELFSTVHSVDRVKIARKLDREAGERGVVLSCFLEVNLGGEPSKSGFPADGLAGRVAPVAGLANLRVVGLMAIPPVAQDEEGARGWFRRLRALSEELGGRAEWVGWTGWLSMGMSGDFEVAVEEGATHVRVGTSLFGARG